MSRVNLVAFLVTGLLASLAAFSACAPDATSSLSTDSSEEIIAPNGNFTSQDIGALARALSSSTLGEANIRSLGNQQVGISVSGQGEVTATPDLALLTLGVEARAKTVAIARVEASRALTDMVEVLMASGLSQADIQTRHFSIYHRYEKQEIAGYTVSNQITAKIRDLEALGSIIDQAAEVGGNLTRIQGISFSVEDPAALKAQALRKAVQAMVAKAEYMAEAANVELGSLIHMTESGGASPRFDTFAPRIAFAEDISSTPISAGELDISVTVQGVFSITQ
jgi:uncharacterized protein YggE